MKIGFLLCDCQGSLSEASLRSISSYLRKMPDTSFVLLKNCFCDDEGLRTVRRTLQEEAVDRLVFGGCSLKSVVRDLRDVIEKVDLRSFMLGVVQLKDSAWVEEDSKLNAEKALVLLKAEAAKLRKQEDLSSDQLRLALIKPDEKLSRRQLFEFLRKGLVEQQPIASIGKEACLSYRGCQLCLQLCPSKALELERGEVIINKSLCDGCGICASRCPTGAVELATQTTRQTLAQIDELLSGKSKILSFVCEKADSSIQRCRIPPSLLPLRLPCLGMIPAAWILYAFQRGAEGVVLLSSRCDDCPRRIGEDRFNQEAGLVKGLLRCCEVEESRVGVIRAEPPEAFSNEAEAFVKEVQALKPKPLPMLRKTPVSTGRVLFTDLLRHLLRSAGLKQRELRTSLFGVVRIDRDRCTRCFVCPTVCPTGALEATEGKLMFSHDACVNCKSCLEICPEEAVEVEEAMKLDLLISPACLLEEELLACERCGSPFIPRHMLQRVGERLRLTEEAKGLLKLCPECRAKQSSPFKDVG